MDKLLIRIGHVSISCAVYSERQVLLNFVLVHCRCVLCAWMTRLKGLLSNKILVLSVLMVIAVIIAFVFCRASMSFMRLVLILGCVEVDLHVLYVRPFVVNRFLLFSLGYILSICYVRVVEHIHVYRYMKKYHV